MKRRPCRVRPGRTIFLYSPARPSMSAKSGVLAGRPRCQDDSSAGKWDAALFGAEHRTAYPPPSLKAACAKFPIQLFSRHAPAVTPWQALV